MSELRRRMMMFLTGYQQVEWLQSDGNAYIETNWRPTVENTRIVSIAIPTLFGSYRHSYRLAGSHESGNSGPGVWCNYPNASGTCGSADLSFGVTLNVNELVTYDLVMANNRVVGTINEQQVNTPYYGSQLTCPRTMWIFRCNELTGTAQNPYVLLKYFAIYNNDILEREFYPCYRRSDNKPGLYDVVNDVFYTNAGTGTFIVGPDIMGGVVIT